MHTVPTNQEDVCAELQDAVHAGQLFKHDGVGYLTEEATHKLPNDQDHRHVQTHDPGRRGKTENNRNEKILHSRRLIWIAPWRLAAV